MKFDALLFSTVCSLIPSFAVALQDRFNYIKTDLENNNYGPDDWNLVKCHNVDDCPGWVSF
jgi:hypothetical protein